MKKISLTDDKQVIRVQLWANGAWKHNLSGQVIGNHDGIVGVLLDTGECIDVSEENLRILGVKECRENTSITGVRT